MITRRFQALPYKVRILAAFAIPWVLTVVISFFLLFHVQRVAGEESARRHLAILSDLLSFSVGAGLSEGNFVLVQKAFDWSRFDASVSYIGILDEQNEIIFQNSTPPQGLDLPHLNTSTAISGFDRGLLSIAPVSVRGKRLGTVVLVYSFDAIEQNIRENQMVSVLVSLPVLILGIWGSNLIARQGGKLERAKAEAESQAATVRSQAEILARTNVQIGRSNDELQAAQRELQQAHDDLEARVIERTNALAEANEALRVNHSRLGVALEAARMLPWNLDLSSGTLQVGRDIADSLGEHPRQLRDWWRHVNRDDRLAVIEAMRRSIADNSPLDIEYRVKGTAGEPSWIASYGRTLKDADGVSEHLVGINMDITERKRAEQALRTSLKEKELLFKEVHHRVKNNMQVISSLLFLQSSYVRDPFDVELFRESQMRVKSMAMVHERLYRSADVSRIELSDYVKTLAAGLLSSYNCTGIRLKTEIDSIRFGVDIAIPCGLIINELVTNAIKHAFPGGKEGTIVVRISRVDGGALNLLVIDDGVGIPADVNYSDGSTLGGRLVQALVEQLEGTISIVRSGGTTVSIAFALPGEAPAPEAGQ